MTAEEQFNAGKTESTLLIVAHDYDTPIDDRTHYWTHRQTMDHAVILSYEVLRLRRVLRNEVEVHLRRIDALKQIVSLPCHCEETRTCPWHIAREALGIPSEMAGPHT